MKVRGNAVCELDAVTLSTPGILNLWKIPVEWLLLEDEAFTGDKSTSTRNLNPVIETLCGQTKLTSRVPLTNVHKSTLFVYSPMYRAEL